MRAPAPRTTSLMVFGGFLALALALTSTDLLGASRYIHDDWHDNEIFFWNFWWFRQALATGVNPMFCPLVFWPEGTSLGLHATNLVHALVALPVQVVLGDPRGVVLAYNGITLLSLSGSAWLAWKLALRLTRAMLPSLAAGVIFGFSAFHLWNIGRLHVASIEGIPMFLLALLPLLRPAAPEWFPEDAAKPYDRTNSVGRDSGTGGGRTGTMGVLLPGLLLGGAGVYLLHTSQGHLVSALLAGALLVALTGRRAVRLLNRRTLGAFGIAAGIGLLASLPMIHAWIAYPEAERGLRPAEESIDFSATPEGWFVPGRQHRVYGAVGRFLDPNRRLEGREIFIGLAPILLIPFACSGACRKRAWPWLWMGGVFAILSLGPWLRWRGEAVSLPMPYGLLTTILPFLQVNRTPIRFAAVVMLAVALLSAFGMAELGRRLGAGSRRSIVLGGIALLALIDRPMRLPMVDRREPPAAYEALTSVPKTAPVLNVPLFHARLERRVMYDQLFHGRPLTIACIPRTSSPPHHLLDGTRLRACLLEPLSCQPAEGPRLGEEIRALGIGAIVLHPEFLLESWRTRLGELLDRAGPLDRVAEPEGPVVFTFARESAGRPGLH